MDGSWKAQHKVTQKPRDTHIISSNNSTIRPDVAALRTTQRAPKSCISCATRKTKCDRRIPCASCIKRGTAGTCARETVVVRGMVTEAGDSRTSDYEKLLEENSRLKAMLSEYERANNRKTSATARPSPSQAVDVDSYMFGILLFDTEPRRSLIADPAWPPIVLPSRPCSQALIDYDHRWNSWVHYAIDYRQFQDEHDSFWQEIEAGKAVEDFDPFWLAVYFSVLTAALLMMDNEDMKVLDLPIGDYERLLNIWYDTALFCLDKAGYMRHYDVRAVQAIAVLGMCFNNFGDCNLYETMWTCAIRIAQKLGMHRAHNQICPSLNQEWCRRLWWTLVICDWMQVPFHVACVTENDFNVPLPSVEEDRSSNSGALLQTADTVVPVQYHIVMSKIALIHHHFHVAMRTSTQPLSNIVRHADSQLADLIETLPAHLQPDETKTEQTEARDEKHPWIVWQRFDLTLVLLYFRLFINQTLQSHWQEAPEQYGGPRAICLQSAKGIIWISGQWDQPIARRSQWALSLYVFAAAICLISEHNQDSGMEDSTVGTDEINQCIDFLDQVKSRNAVAYRGVEILKNLIR